MTDQVIGYEMQRALGFKVFLNKGGNISISQECDYNGMSDEQLIVLTRNEAEQLSGLLLELATEENCREMVEHIYEDEDNGRIRDVLESISPQGSESGSPQSLGANSGN